MQRANIFPLTLLKIQFNKKKIFQFALICTLFRVNNHSISKWKSFSCNFTPYFCVCVLLLLFVHSFFSFYKVYKSIIYLINKFVLVLVIIYSLRAHILIVTCSQINCVVSCSQRVASMISKCLTFASAIVLKKIILFSFIYSLFLYSPILYLVWPLFSFYLIKWHLFYF